MGVIVRPFFFVDFLDFVVLQLHNIYQRGVLMKKRYMVALDEEVMQRYQAAVKGLRLGKGMASQMLNDLIRDQVTPVLERTVQLQQQGQLNSHSLFEMLNETAASLEKVREEIQGGLFDE